jgi:hypothetical protein
MSIINLRKGKFYKDQQSRNARPPGGCEPRCPAYSAGDDLRVGGMALQVKLLSLGPEKKKTERLLVIAPRLHLGKEKRVRPIGITP